LQEAQDVRRGLRTVAARLVQRIAGPEVARALNDDPSCEEAACLSAVRKASPCVAGSTMSSLVPCSSRKRVLVRSRLSMVA
jgi:hypothetical protein